MNFHQTVEDILRAATPEQKILWNYIFLRWGERVAISQYIYFGSTLGAGEILVYSPNKLYICYEFEIDGAPFTGVAGNYISFFNEGNFTFQNISNNSIAWDAVGAAIAYMPNQSTKKNFYFSRLAVNAINSNIKFIGYRIGV